jgi:hypothetical protein
MAPSPLRKNLENEESPVIHRKLHVSLKVALLPGAQSLVKKNLRRTRLQSKLPNFFRFARADKQRSIRGSPFANYTPYRL